MFCTSLRRRSSFAAVLPQLTQTTSLALKESNLETHDLSITLSTAVEPRTGVRIPHDHLHVLLLSPSSTKDDTAISVTLHRIRRFATSNRTGAKLVIIFLLNPPRETTFQSARHQMHTTTTTDDDATRKALANGWRAYNTLQWRIFEDEFIPRQFPLLPLPTLDVLPSMLSRYTQGLKRPHMETKEGGVETLLRLALLRQCTAATKPMSEQTALVLSGVFGSVRELMEACTKPATDQGRLGADVLGVELTSEMSSSDGPFEKLRGLVSDEERRDLVDFWQEEWTVE